MPVFGDVTHARFAALSYRCFRDILSAKGDSSLHVGVRIEFLRLVFIEQQNEFVPKSNGFCRNRFAKFFQFFPNLFAKFDKEEFQLFPALRKE